MGERILVTGANGCIGAWVVKALVAEGVGVVAFDKVVDEHRHRLVNAGGLPDVDWRIGDLTVLDDVMAAAEGAARMYIDKMFEDRPDLAEALTPKYPFWGKRTILSDQFYPALKQPNVKLSIGLQGEPCRVCLSRIQLPTEIGKKPRLD